MHLGIEEALIQFERDGYAIVRGVLRPEDLAPVIEEYDAVANRLADRLLADGTISGFDRTAATDQKIVELMRRTDGSCFQSLDITLPIEDRIQADTPMHLGAAVFELLRNDRLLDAIETFLGGEIYSVPVQHMRVKPPERHLARAELHTMTLVGQTYWHQDLVVVAEEADDTDMLGVWFALNDVDLENGCLVVVPGSHKLGLVHHCDEPGRQGIPPELVEGEPRALPVSAGDVIFLHPLIMHSSLSNRSDGGRWSFDLRYCKTGQPTGRSWFPGFVARSRSDPSAELKDPALWASDWLEARARLAGKPRPNFHHPSAPGHPLCA